MFKIEIKCTYYVGKMLAWRLDEFLINWEKKERWTVTLSILEQIITINT